MEKRTEKDSLGNVEVSGNVYWGPQTQRAVDNFPISGSPLPAAMSYAYAVVKRAAATANMSTRRLESRKGHAIIRACDEIMKGQHADQFVVDAFQAGAGTSTNMNVNEVIANRATELLGGKKGEYRVHPNDDVNMAQSTNDTFHTAMHVAAVLEMKELLAALEELHAEIEKKASEYRRLVKSGRTHLMDAVPVTLGQEFSGYAAAVEKDIRRIEKSMDALLEVNIGGTAVGTGLNAEPKYIKGVVREIGRLTKQKFRSPRNLFEATQNMGAVLEASSALRGLAVDLIKISGDIRLMYMINEIAIPVVQPGSSIMPGKANPSVPEMAGMVGYQVIGNDTAIVHACSASQFELNAMMPVACRNILESIKILANACRILNEKCVSGMTANEEVIRHNLEKNVALVTALAPYIGYDKAADAAKKARAENKTIRQVLLETHVASGKELDNLLDLIEMTKPGIPKKNR